MLAPPPVEFVVRRGVHIAYQSAGSGPPEIVFVAGSTAMSVQWEQAATAKSLRRLASFARLVTYDQQGMGFSDRMDLSAPPTMEDLVADLEAVVAAAKLSEPILFGTHNGGAVAALYASRHPVNQLVLCNTWARLEVADDFPIGFSPRVLDRLGERYETDWGGGQISDEFASRRRRTAGSVRAGVDEPEPAGHLFRINRRYDIRSVLPTISVPTLVIHLEDNSEHPALSTASYIAQAIPGARLVLLPGTDQVFLRNYAHARHRRGGAVRHGPPSRLHRPHAGHHAVHRHRRLHPLAACAGRRGLERADRRAQRSGAAPGRRPRWS